MFVSKNEILNIISYMPDEFDIEDIMYKLFVFDKLKTAELDIDEQNLVKQNEIIEMVDLWLNK